MNGSSGEKKLQLVFPSSCTNSALVEPFLEIALKKNFHAALFADGA
jgi:hypothetical protein